MRTFWRNRPPKPRARWWERTWVWVFSYPLLILIFTVVYWSQAFSFYQTTAIQEPSAVNDEPAVEQAVSAGADANIEQQARVDGCSAECGPLFNQDAIGITVNSADIVVTLAFSVPTNDQGTTIQVDIPEASLASTSSDGNNQFGVPYFIIASQNLTGAAALGGGLRLFEQFTSSTTNPVMPVSADEIGSIEQLANAAQGVVGYLPGQFARMLYFSAVSATTLGFGDIVPVTSGSRLLVTSEALLGVVIVGLFLNSLARRPQDARGSQADELVKLASLRDSGVLSAEEFSQLKAKVMAG